jgi:hypothetical protein
MLVITVIRFPPQAEHFSSGAMSASIAQALCLDTRAEA